MKNKFLLALCICTFTSLTACNAVNSSTNDIEETVLIDPISMSLQTATVSRQNLFTMKTYNGEINPSVTNLFFPYDGTFLEYSVNSGSPIEKGTVIAKSNDDVLQDNIENLEDNYKQFLDNYTYQKSKKENQLNISNYDLEIMHLTLTEAYEKYNKSYYDMEYLRLQIDNKKASIEREKIELAQFNELFTLDDANYQRKISILKSKLGVNNIIAPYDGTIVSLYYYKTGDSIDPTKATIAYGDTNNIVIQCDYISETAVNSSNRIYAHIGDKEYDLTYIPYDPAVLSSLKMKGKTPVSTFTINNIDEQIKIGDFAIVIVISDEKENVLSIPSSAIYKDSLGTYVYKVVDNVKTKVTIEIGFNDGYNTEIIDGLLEGDVVYVGK